MTWVLYKDIVHIIVKDYENGLVDIREVNGYRITLVEKSDLEILIEGR